jgi:hypothetical protein
LWFLKLKNVAFVMLEAEQTNQQHDSAQSRTLNGLLNKNLHQWSKKHSPYTEKLNAVRDWITKTGQPITVVDNPAFRAMVNKLDAKFEIPGECLLRYDLHCDF